MKGLDTNVLIRYLVGDHVEQTRKAAKFIERECSVDEPAVINRIVICELVWVLESAYRYRRAQVAVALEKILRTRQFVVEDRQAAWLSLIEYRRGHDFADALIGKLNRQLGCEHTVTFDRRAARHEDFVLL